MTPNLTQETRRSNIRNQKRFHREESKNTESSPLRAIAVPWALSFPITCGSFFLLQAREP